MLNLSEASSGRVWLDRFSELERGIENLRSEFNLFHRKFKDFKKQFEPTLLKS